jgi:hypothetical protein
MRARNYNLGSTFAADATTLDVLSANVTLGLLQGCPLQNFSRPNFT